MPIELIWIAGLVLVMVLGSAFVMVPPEALMEAGNTLGVGSVLAGFPLELIYFGLLAWALRRHGARPAGWYWRSFAYHGSLSRVERWVVLPWFIAGSLCFVGGVLGIVIVIMGAIASLL
ncbi:MAG: hypothetical protein R3A78_16065 [Polyangiales bacterium]|nr:hypothetical protein [Myxococcales bacterium]